MGSGYIATRGEPQYGKENLTNLLHSTNMVLYFTTTLQENHHISEN